MERFLTVGEAARELHVTDKTIRNLIDRKRFTIVRVGTGQHGGKILIPKESLEAYIASVTQPAETA